MSKPITFKPKSVCSHTDKKSENEKRKESKNFKAREREKERFTEELGCKNKAARNKRQKEERQKLGLRSLAVIAIIPTHQTQRMMRFLVFMISINPFLHRLMASQVVHHIPAPRRMYRPQGAQWSKDDSFMRKKNRVKKRALCCISGNEKWVWEFGLRGG